MSNELVSAANVLLDCPATTRGDAVRAVAQTLVDDPRIVSWAEFWESVGARQVVDLKGCGCGVTMAHGRGSSVKDLVLAAGRLAQPLPVEGASDVRLVFVFGIPAAMAEEYLRSVGTLARACSQPDRLTPLLESVTPGEFAGHLRDLVG